MRGNSERGKKACGRRRRTVRGLRSEGELYPIMGRDCFCVLCFAFWLILIILIMFCFLVNTNNNDSTKKKLIYK